MKNFVDFTKAMAVVNNKLRAVEFKSVTFSPTHEVIYITVQTEDGSSYELWGEEVQQNIYKTEEDFRKGCAICKRCETNHVKKWLVSDEENHLYLKAWTMKDGEPHEVKERVLNYTLHKSERYRTNFHEFIKGILFEHDDTVQEESLYETREECLAYNEYKVIVDGEEKTRRGDAMLIRLTDEQKNMLKDFAGMMKKLKESGIRFAYNADNCEVGVFNVSGFDEYKFDWEGGNEGMRVIDTTYIDYSFANEFGMEYLNGDYSMFAKVKE